MTDSIGALADDYYRAYLAANPTEAHLLGHYEHAAEFEDSSRAEEDRQIAGLRALRVRAVELDDAGLDAAQLVT
ncbi:MAG: hypothetical protein JWP74_3904 [Marmoricola sp.]|nr:hypothetical protein [Marmoricola sp.]